MRLRTTALLALLLALAPGELPAQEEPDPVTAAQRALDQALEKKRDLEQELVRAYRKIEADLDRLRGPDGDELRAALAEMVTETANSTPRGAEYEETVARTLVNRLGTSDLLSAPVAGRFARAVADRIVRFKAEPPAAAAAALDEIFAEDDVADVWDAQFLNLPVVARWREANVDVELRQLELDRLHESDGEEIPPPVEMVLVPGGRFVFGPHIGWTTDLEGSDSPQLPKLAPYYIDVHEVTNKAYLEFVMAQPEDERRALLPVGWTDDPPAFPARKELYPVTSVTFPQAAAYAEWAGKRIPTEREWEKAARGDDKEGPRLWPWGNEFDPEKDRDALVWRLNTASGPARILSKARDRSPFLVRDMAGNVKEWTSTRREGNKDVRTRDIPKLGATDQLVIRGGSYRTEEPRKAQVNFRWVLSATGRSEDVGFRCVLDASEWRRRRR